MKRLVPLGFTRSDIRKELYLSHQGGQEGADLVVQYVEGSGAESPPLSLGGVASEGEGQGTGKQEGEGKEEEGKVFAIQCMQVSLCSCSKITKK